MPVFRLTVCLFGTVAIVACFGTPDFGANQATATKFARALQDGDTVQMAALSLPVAGSKMAAAQRDLPPAYVAFARPTPQLVTREAGGKGYSSFFVASTLLRACDGGVEVQVVNGDRPLVAAVRPVPPIDSADADPCREIITRLPAR